MPINFQQIETDLRLLQGIADNKLYYLDQLYITLMEHFVILSTQATKMKTKMMILESAKGRKEMEYPNDMVIDFGEEYGRVVAYLELVNKCTSIVQQKVKIMEEIK